SWRPSVARPHFESVLKILRKGRAAGEGQNCNSHGSREPCRPRSAEAPNCLAPLAYSHIHGIPSGAMHDGQVSKRNRQRTIVLAMSIGTTGRIHKIKSREALDDLG